MHYIKERLKEKNSNLIKDLKKICLDLLISDDIDECLIEFYNEFTDICDEKGIEFDEYRFYLYVKNNINEENFVIEEEKIITIKASLKDYPQNYRIICVPNNKSFSDIVYGILAAFNICKCHEYVLEYKDVRYYPSRFHNSSFFDKHKCSERVFIKNFDLEISDTMILKYDKKWILNLEIIEIEDNDDYIDDVVLLKINGLDIFEGDNSYVFDYLIKEDFEGLKNHCDNNEIYEYYLKYYKDKKYVECGFDRFRNLFSLISEFYDPYEETDDF